MSAESFEELLKPTVIVEPFYAAGGTEVHFLKNQIIVRLVAGGKISIVVQPVRPAICRDTLPPAGSHESRAEVDADPASYEKAMVWFCGLAAAI